MCLALASPALAADMTYIQEDAEMSGQTMHVFADAGEQVTVVLGGFRLEVGKRVVTAREAVLWIKEYKFGAGVRRDVIMYLRGRARIVEPDGASTGDQSMLVTLHQQGRLAASGVGGGRINLSRQSLVGDPLYLEALTVRQKSSVRRPGETNVALPPILSATAPASTPTPRPTAPATQPRKPVKPKLPQEVTFRFEKMTVQELEPGRHAIVAQGGVYLGQGDVKSDLYLELRSQSAVVFTEPIPPDAAKRPLPYAPPPLVMSGTSAKDKENIAGVYLEGNVVITRGERTMDAKAAYYDFVHQQAYVVEPIFRTVQDQRNIPVYIRADEARVLSASETWFKNARITTSDFHTPEYHMGASEVTLKDATEYDELGKPVSEKKYHATIKDETFNLYNVPVMYWPYSEADLAEDTIPLRSFGLGTSGDMGFGVQTSWDAFRLLGMVKPDGTRANFDFDAYEKGVITGVDAKYARHEGDRQYSGYDKFYGVFDSSKKDTLGTDVKNVPAPQNRGWVLMRHKELLPQDVELQFELSYISDRNFLERYFPSEYFSGKEQETLVYAKKQQDNWAATALLQTRINNFQTETGSYPDLAFFLIGESLLGDRLTYFNESRAGLKVWRPDDDSDLKASPLTGRADTRNELDWPLKAGPIKVVPYVVARGTAWSASPDDPTDAGSDGSGNGGVGRPYGQAGLKTQTHIWRVYDDVDNRLFDIHQLKHEITPQVAGFVSGDGGVTPATASPSTDLYPMDPGIEQHLGQINAASLALYQRLVTKRGPPGNQFNVDWMRLDVVATVVNNHDVPVGPADGRSFFSRPEYSIPRDSINGDYTWNISDATAFLADANYDTESAGFGRADAGFAVTRDPRLRYYFGWRYIRDLDSSAGTFGTNYQINKKYSISLFEQYDFLYDSGRNLATSVSIIRKFPRWYGAFTLSYDERNNEVVGFISVWPEGIPEARLTGERLNLLGPSSNN